MKTVYPSHLLIFITILSLFAVYTSAAPTSFAEVEESWQRGLSENEIHKETTQHPTPSYHHHFHLHRHRHIPSSPQSSSPSNTGTDVEEAEFQGMLDARTMAVRRKLHRVIGRRGEFGIFGQKREKNVETEGEVGETDVLRPVRNRRWQF